MLSSKNCPVQVTGLKGVDLGVPDVAAMAPDRPNKITHVVFNTPRQEEAAQFWVDALGFSVSDRSLLTFLRRNSGHHSIAFHPGERASLHHIAFEMADIDSVMRGAGRMRDAGALARRLGLPGRSQRPGERHPPAQRAHEGRAEENRLRRRPVPPIK